MIYHDFHGKQLSGLGLGCMRLPALEDKQDQIDMLVMKEMVDYAMAKGVNYYDTAWGYHNGQSEVAIGELLRAYPRESYYLASKYPGYDLSTLDKKEEIFEKQLEKCGVDYFDFYLFHNVCEMNIDGYLDPQYDILNYLMEQKAKGRIHHLGFSTHGSLETMKRFLDACDGAMEFCQIQLNWLDWDYQDAKAKVELLKEYNIPVWVMEPIRGGSLINISEEDAADLRKAQPDWTMPEWAFRFLQSIDGVKVVLSGMSNLQQVQENIETFSEKVVLSQEEFALLNGLAKKMISRNKVLCTYCRYCTTKCPIRLNIPWLLKLYNEYLFSGKDTVAPEAMDSVPESKWPNACLGCRSCEAVCPQQIEISQVMADFAEKLK